jgi:hypothetical protein
MRTVKCAVCESQRDADDEKDVPLLYNVGEGPRYVGVCCYEFFSFTAVMFAYEAKQRAIKRAAQERAQLGARYHHGKRKQQQR